MELPAPLRQAIDEALEGVALADLARAADALSQRYRGEVRDGRLHVADDLAARAYLAARLPATYAAVAASMRALAEVRPDFAPRRLLDAGAGPGTALWAATTQWPGIQAATLIEASPAIRRWGETFSGLLPLKAEWRTVEFDNMAADRADLVLLSYVLDELDEPARVRLIDRLWAATDDVLLIVEPGRPAGWTRILAARERLIAAGAHLLAPCPHAAACPLTAPDWCHFVRRVARSRLHRLAKSADVPWEDEKFIYIAASRTPGAPVDRRVIAPPRGGSGKVELKLCRRDGSAAAKMVTRREGEVFKRARRAEWGDAI
jgi:ribosomal protein RSM22 (predicted rRNA methylase)